MRNLSDGRGSIIVRICITAASNYSFLLPIPPPSKAIYLSFKETNDGDGTHLALEAITHSHFYWFNLCYSPTRVSKAHFWTIEELNISQWKHTAGSAPRLGLISFAFMFGSCHLEWLDRALRVLFTTENKVQHNTDQQNTDSECYSTLCFPPAVVCSIRFFVCFFFPLYTEFLSFILLQV